VYWAFIKTLYVILHIITCDFFTSMDNSLSDRPFVLQSFYYKIYDMKTIILYTVKNPCVLKECLKKWSSAEYLWQKNIFFKRRLLSISAAFPFIIKPKNSIFFALRLLNSVQSIKDIFKKLSTEHNDIAIIAIIRMIRYFFIYSIFVIELGWVLGLSWTT
jgi:hypothetical protein